MSHYMCTGGCDGIADTQGTCQAPDCPKYQQQLVQCSFVCIGECQGVSDVPGTCQAAECSKYQQQLVATPTDSLRN